MNNQAIDGVGRENGVVFRRYFLEFDLMRVGIHVRKLVLTLSNWMIQSYYTMPSKYLMQFHEYHTPTEMGIKI